MTLEQLKQNKLKEFGEYIFSRVTKTICNLEKNRNWHGRDKQYILDPELVQINLLSLRDDIDSFIKSRFPQALDYIQNATIEEAKKVLMSMDIEYYTSVGISQSHSALESLKIK